MVNQLERVDFKVGLNRAVADQQRVFGHDRSKTVGGSEVFHCLRGVAYDKRWPELATEPDEVDWGRMERGNVAEKWVVEKLQAMFGHDNCILMGDNQKTFFDEYLSTTPDGIVVGLSSTALAGYGIPDMGFGDLAIEIKSCDPNTHLDGQPKAAHAGQIQCQMGVENKFTNYKPGWGAVLYFNPLNLQDMLGSPFFVRRDERVYERAKQRAADVYDLTKTSPLDYPAEGKYLDECRYCPFKAACSAAEAKAYPDKVVPASSIAAHTLEECERLTKSVDAKRQQINALETSMKEDQVRLQEKMSEIGTNRIGGLDADGRKWSASYIRCKGRITLNKTLLSESGLDLTPYEKEGNPYFQFRTKVEAG